MDNNNADYKGVLINHTSLRGGGNCGGDGCYGFKFDDKRANNLSGAYGPSFVITRTGTTTISNLFQVDSHSVNGLAVSDSGNVGIGTTTPGTAKLAILGGNVGIGTASPGSKLMINDTSKTPDGYIANSNLSIITTDAAANNAGGSLLLGGANGQGVSPFGFGQIKGAKEPGGTWGGYLAFFTTQNNSGMYERLRIDSNGNVGIGTTGPTSKLNVDNGDIKVTNSAGAGATREISVSNVNTGGGYTTAIGAMSSASYIRSIGGDPLQLRDGNDVNMIILGNGNVGIGTTNPGAYKLYVNGNTNVVGSVTWTGGDSSHLGTGVNVTTYVGNSSVNNAIIRSNNNSNDAWLMNWGDSAAYGIYNRNIDSALAVSGALTIPANSTAFIGAGLAKAYINHANGDAGFAGTVTAGAFSGSWAGTVIAGNVSSGYFGQNTGGGEYHFPSNVYLDGDYGKSIIGLYSASRYQGVFAMGDSYKLVPDGTGPGTLYGIAWTHSNVGGQSKAGLSHQALFMTNGVTQTAIGTGIWTLGGYTQSGGSSNTLTGATTIGNKTAITDAIASADSSSYSTFGVTREASSTALAYISMTRAGRTVKAMGIDSSNNWIFGNPTYGTQAIASPYLSINSSGFIGMSTTPNASYRLDVNGVVRATSFSGNYLGIVNATNVSAGEFGVTGGGGDFIFGRTVTGNVGIGKLPTSPVRLDVSGRVQFDKTGTYTAYSWAGGELQTNSVEILDKVGGTTGDGIYPTLTFHDYGNGGAQFSMEGLTTTLHLGSGAANSAATLGKAGSYFSKLKIWGGLETTGSVGIGTTTIGTDKLSVIGNSSFTGGVSIIGNLVMSGSGDITADKLTVNTIDPLYSIGGTNYASFAASIVGGVKEEVMGKLKIKNKVGDEYEAIIDFNKQEKGGDLWVWRKVIDFNKDSVEAIITPYGNFANTYYYISGNSLIFRSDRPTEISYRLTAKRFDWRNWPTLPTDQTEKAGMIIE